ncbi:MAG: AIPR family protein [Sphingopyxis sp.]|uniref:AIPR family protein n=1 Tax=Sphingopyxis sp. TaxID=1908224 RepID=UPI003D6D2207
MNPVNQAQMKEFAEAYDLEEKSESDQFELYTIYSIINGGSGENIDPFDAHLTGTEFGLDGVAIIVQGNLVTDADEAATAIADTKNPQIDFYFFQSKTSAGFDYGEMSKFFDSVKGFFSGQLSKESAQLDDLIEAKDYLYTNGVKRRNPGIYCYFASTGSYEKQQRIERLVENTKNELTELSIFDEENLEINIYGASQLQRLYRAASTSTEVTLDFKESVVLPRHESVGEGYIGYIPASELLKVVSIYNESGEIIDINKSVFFDNIRDYNSNSKINKEISSSLENGEHDNFVYRNNGITVVARSINRIGNNFTIEDFQIVNGCQTSNVVFHNRDNIENVFVPFRLIGTKDEDFIFSIISGTNKQNPVRDEQFWSLLPFMKNLEEFSRNAPTSKKIFLERRENQYRSEAVERARIVQMQPFFKAVTAGLLGAPHRAARNYKAEIGDNVEDIFEERQDVRPSYAIAFLHYRLEFMWRNQKINAATKIYRFYIIDAAVRQVLGRRAFIGLSNKEKIKFSEELIKLSADETRLSRVVSSVEKALETHLMSSGAATAREKLRDTIRSETFFLGVRGRYTPVAGTLK